MKTLATLTICTALTAFGASTAIAGTSQANSTGNLCGSGEKVLFSCGYGQKIASVCAVGDATIYRFGQRSAVELEIKSNGHDNLAYKSTVVGQGQGGQQNSIRFRRGDYSYIVSAGESGSLSDSPGTSLDAISVMKGHKDVASHECKRTVSAHLLDAHVPDEPDSSFEMWY